ncbi:PspC domain-containing protein [Thermobrachium celere]|uniref:PspC domain protein, truncated n=1 Tax=Thermobrachium celere DSM 8682 TaxID=941824 RepID=R7RRY1_9CLOT|nr:PspC domain-containing protein [Thermobrachium celere]GFR34834.1 PspC domain-containing protein [Thermobrachium celere]CDF58834.1 PspC domain protein, truncated [Thermobrachium celere DSM 8682]
MEKKLYRSRTDRMIAGVCGGIAKYFDIDPTIVRLFWVFATLVGGSGILAYIVCAIVIPLEPIE